MNSQPNHPPLSAPNSPYLKKRSPLFLISISLFGLALAFIINILDPFIYTEKVRQLAPLALKNTALSFITITTLAVAFGVQPLIGRWSDRTRHHWGKRAPFLVAGVMGVSLALVLVIKVESLWLLLAAAALVSACTNTIQSPWQALVPDRVPAWQHGTTAGIKTLVESIGAVAGLAWVGFSLSRGHLWAAPLTAIALFWLILAITLLTLRAAPVTNPSLPDRSLERVWPAINFKFGHLPPALPWWMLNRFLFWAAAIAVRTFLLNYLNDVHGLSLAEAEALSSRILLGLGAGVFLLVLPSGMIADRIGRRPLLIVAGLLAAIGAGLFVGLRDLNLLFIAGGLIAGGAGIFASASWSLVTNIVPNDEGALYLGLANAATILGSVAGRLGGPVIDGVNHLTGTLTAGYLVVFGLAALFFGSSSAVVFLIEESSRS